MTHASAADPLAKVAPHKKRKRGKGKGQGANGNAAGAADGAGPAAGGPEGPGAAALEPWQRETSVQLAVLELLETLLQVGNLADIPASSYTSYATESGWIRLGY